MQIVKKFNFNFDFFAMKHAYQHGLLDLFSFTPVREGFCETEPANTVNKHDYFLIF